MRGPGVNLNKIFDLQTVVTGSDSCEGLGGSETPHCTHY